MNIITLDVGGKFFKCNKDLLISRCKYFEDLFAVYDEIKDGEMNTNEIIFIDRSPHIFKHILALIRDSRYQYPKKYNEELYYFLMKKRKKRIISKEINSKEFKNLSIKEKFSLLEEKNLYVDEIECFKRLKTRFATVELIYKHDSINCNCDNCKIYRINYFINTGNYFSKNFQYNINIY